jgi:Trypsin-co-occurring domain 1
MSYLIEVPLTAGGRLLVEACADDVPGGIDLAARRPGDIVTRARKSIEQALEEISPAIHSVIERLTAMSPAGVTLEFGIVLGAESGAVIAKGTGAGRKTPRRGRRGPGEDSGAGEDSGPGSSAGPGRKTGPCSVSGLAGCGGPGACGLRRAVRRA